MTDEIKDTIYLTILEFSKDTDLNNKIIKSKTYIEALINGKREKQRNDNVIGYYVKIIEQKENIPK